MIRTVRQRRSAESPDWRMAQSGRVANKLSCYNTVAIPRRRKARQEEEEEEEEEDKEREKRGANGRRWQRGDDDEMKKAPAVVMTCSLRV